MEYNYEELLSGLIGGATILAIVLVVFLIAGLIISIIALWKVFEKAGKKGWHSIIPFYGYWVLTEIAGLNWWWFLLLICDSFFSIFEIDELSTLANLVSLFASFNCYYNIAKRFNKTNGYSICAGIFSGIFVLLLGFSKKEVYDENIAVSKNGIFGKPETTMYDTSNNSTINYSNQDTTHSYENVNFCGNCGTKLNNEAKFCPNCGKEINN